MHLEQLSSKYQVVYSSAYLLRPQSRKQVVSGLYVGTVHVDIVKWILVVIYYNKISEFFNNMLVCFAVQTFNITGAGDGAWPKLWDHTGLLISTQIYCWTHEWMTNYSIFFLWKCYILIRIWFSIVQNNDTYARDNPQNIYVSARYDVFSDRWWQFRTLWSKTTLIEIIFLLDFKIIFNEEQNSRCFFKSIGFFNLSLLWQIQVHEI